MFNGDAKIERPESDTGEAALVEAVRVQARGFFHGARGSHDWEHTERVLRLCRRIGPVEGADMPVLLVAAILHDIGRGEQDRTAGEICHARHGAEKALAVVRSLPLSPDRQENVLHCIRSHRFRGREHPSTLEARVLFDADKLDAIGAVGVARAFLFAGEVGARLHNPDVDPAETRPYSEEDTGYREYRLKLRKIKDRMLTAEGRRLAQERHAFMEAFFNRFIEEYQGKR
jgi:uncharacterized protein